ncbi:MAG: hypothetical protein INF91_05840 [Alphaproteobacteria bacterium]|nr:hypothetical protein [Alphaproteobacteria bacterium]
MQTILQGPAMTDRSTARISMHKTLVTMAVALLSSAAMAQTVSAKDPASFSQALVELGYKPTPFTLEGNIQIATAVIDDWNTAFGLGGCEARKNCKYVIVASGFSDIRYPPLSWVNETNDTLDLAKLVVNKDKSLSLRMAVPIGPDGIPLSTLRFVLEQWRASVARVAQSAIDRKLTNPQ